MRRLNAEVATKESQIRELERTRKAAEREKRLADERLVKSREAAEHIRAGINHYQRGEYPAAVEQYRAALAIDPTNPIVYDWMGYALYCHRQYVDALEALRRSVEMDPTYARGFYNMALILWKLGDHKSALDAVKRAVELKPGIKNDLKTDKQFDSFRDIPEFQHLIGIE